MGKWLLLGNILKMQKKNNMEINEIGVEPKVLEKLKEPFELKWRVQKKQNIDNKPMVLMVAYIDARDVMDRLDKVLGPHNWTDDYFEINRKVYCKLGINIKGNWIYKTDVGTAGSFEKDKAEASDAFKRASVKWGINRDAYRIGIVRLPAREHGKNWFPCHDDGEFIKPEDLAEACKVKIDKHKLENYYFDTYEEEGHNKVNDFFDEDEP